MVFLIQSRNIKGGFFGVHEQCCVVVVCDVRRLKKNELMGAPKCR